MKICYFIDEFEGPNAGTEGQLYSLIQRLVEKGHEVVLFVLRSTSYTDTVSDFPCQIVLLSIGSLVSFRTLFQLMELRREIRRIRPDVLHAYFNDSALLVPLLASRRTCRIFTSRRDMGYWYTPLRAWCLRLVNSNCTAIVCNAKAVATNTEVIERVSQRRTVVIYNGIEVSNSSRSIPANIANTEPGSLRQFNICLVANLRPIKQIEDLIEAAAILRRERPATQFRYLLIGRTLVPTYETQLARLAQSLGVADSIQFFGESHHPRALMSSCHLGVLTSASEGLSNTLLEYFAEGLPVVCTNVGGNSEIVQDGINGYLYQSRDVEALATAILKIADNPALHQQLSLSASARLNDFSMTNAIQKHEELYLTSPL